MIGLILVLPLLVRGGTYILLVRINSLSCYLVEGIPEALIEVLP